VTVKISSQLNQNQFSANIVMKNLEKLSKKRLGEKYYQVKGDISYLVVSRG
jgi:hypothetical protein